MRFAMSNRHRSLQCRGTSDGLDHLQCVEFGRHQCGLGIGTAHHRGDELDCRVPIANSLASGDYTVSITYSGDSNYAVSSTPTIVHLSVGKIAPTISWTPPVTTITYGATLSSILNAGASNGSTTVAGSFAYTATILGGSAVAVTGVTVLNPGQYTLTATFTPTDSSTYTSVTATSTLTVKDFTLNVPTGGSTSASVLPGGTATYALTFAPSTGTTFPSAVALAVTGAPGGAVVTITPQTIPAGSGSTNVAPTIQVPQTAVASLRQKNVLALQASTLMLGMFLLPFGGMVRRGESPGTKVETALTGTRSGCTNGSFGMRLPR
jgi:hypothetical protein